MPRDPFLGRVVKTLREEHLLTDGERVLVAISGGPDSTALLAVLVEIGKWRLEAVHVHHGLRAGEADRDAEAARVLAARLGVGFRLRELKGLRHGEAAARKAREAAFVEVARDVEATAVAVGHTRDDQAETVLYRAARGAGAAGLRGILPSRALAPGVRIVRPLIDATRHEVLAYLGRQGLAAVIDSSNADLRFARNRIRHETLPSLEKARPGATRHLAEMARTAAELQDWIAEEANRALPRCRDGAGLSLASLRALPGPLVAEVVALACPQAGRLSAVHRRGLAKLLAENRRSAPIGHGWTVTRTGDAVRFDPPVPDAPPALATRIEESFRLRKFLASKSDREEAFDLEQVSLPVTLRPPRRGELFRGMGAPGRRKIQDILTDLKVPRSLRPSIRVAEDAAGRSLWLAGLRRSDAAPVTASTRRVLVLRLEAGSPVRAT